MNAVAWKTLAEKRDYQRQWALRYRHAIIQALYDAGDRSRHVVNGLGRAHVSPGTKWCAWGQHGLPRAAFRHSCRNKDGLQDTCRSCQDMLGRASRQKRKAS